MLSMTGYGRGEFKQNGIELTVEIKTVNNRYLDVVIKSPKIFVGYEDVIRGIIREHLTRGHADVFISLTDKREKQRALYVDEAVAGSYVQAAVKLAALYPQLLNDFTITALMRQNDVLRPEDVISCDDELLSALKQALESSLKSLNAMRKIEGDKLAKDMLGRVKTIEGLVCDVEKRAPLVAEGYKAKLEEKLKKYLENVEHDESRLLMEVAIFADKSNIDEELTRLHSHIAQFRQIAAEEIVGRKLDFLVQEFNRETNTICSKSNDITITKCGLDLKNEIEKVREQVQNVE